jgi:hypothetical protein
MNDNEVFHRCGRNGDAGDSFGRRRQGGEERERQVLDSLAKLGPFRSIPRINGVESFERRHTGLFHDSHQVQAGIRDRPSAVGKSNQGQNRSRRPDFRVVRAGGFERGQGQDDVSDRAGAYQESSHFSLYSVRALSRSTMRANSTALARSISPSRSIPVSAMPSASRPVVAAI